MTYSFSARGRSKTDALVDFDFKHDKFVSDTSIHVIDKNILCRHVRDLVHAIDEPDYAEEVMITVHGYIVYADTPSGDIIVKTINCSASASLVVRR